MSSGRVALTGATGFIGSRLVRTLRERGLALRCLARRTSRTEPLRELGAEIALVDLERGEGLEAALEGVDSLIHVAGVVRAWDAPAYARANVDATRSIALAARRAGVRRLVLVSSLAAAGPSDSVTPRDERHPAVPVCDYGRSKLAAELALAEAAGGALSYSIVRPCAVYGPGDRDFYELFRLAAGRMGLVPYAAPPSQRLSMVYVDDLVELIVAAAERAPSGAVYFASDGGSYTWDEIIREIGAALGRRVVPLRIPPAFLAPAALAVELLRPFRSRPPILCADKLREARQAGWVCSSARAARELGFAPRVTLRDGIVEATRWYREAGWLAR